MNSIQRWTLKWKHGEAEIQSLGGMLAPVRFDLGSNRSISPMQVAWEDDGSQVGLMRALRGEWPCLPFGMVDAPANLPSEYARHEADDAWVHGFGANHMWQLADHDEHSLTLRIDYPEESGIERLERKIEADPDSPALTVSLTVHARRDVVMPFALHPTFTVPASGVEIIACPFDAIHTYPVPQEPSVSRIMPNRVVSTLRRVPTAHGPMDVTRLPMPEKTEELLQLAGCKPPFVLRYIEQRADVFLDWNADDLPDALLWISNGGRAREPWSGRHYALGVEPANSFFDLGRVATPDADHPLASRKGLAFSAGESRTIAYRLSACLSGAGHSRYEV